MFTTHAQLSRMRILGMGGGGMSGGWKLQYFSVCRHAGRDCVLDVSIVSM